MGNDLTNMPLLVALIVATVSSTLVVVLSELGIPVSVVVISTMSIVGLGWGRATRTVSISQVRHGERPEVTMDALTADEDSQTVGGGGSPDADEEPAPIGKEDTADIEQASDLFRPGASARVIGMQNIVPALATISSFLIFQFVLGP